VITNSSSMLRAVERKEHEDFLLLFTTWVAQTLCCSKKIKDEASLWIVAGSKHLAKLVARICALCLYNCMLLLMQFLCFCSTGKANFVKPPLGYYYYLLIQRADLLPVHKRMQFSLFKK
jgi:hypothetical protein